MQMPFCPNCSETYHEGDEYCPKCGAEIQKRTKKLHSQSNPPEVPVPKPKGPSVPIIEFEGTNGSIQLFENFVRLNRGGLKNLFIFGPTGLKDIYFRNITAIQIKKPGLTAGYLQFTIHGGIESVGSVLSAVSDENSITFNKNCYEKALQIKEYIEKANSSPPKSASSEADEIEKLHNLMKKGIITQKEFETKKKQLLDK